VALALLLAAGRGERLESSLPKAFVPLAGRPMLQWSLDVLARVEAIERIVIALPPAGQDALAAGSPSSHGASHPLAGLAPPRGIALPAHAVCVPGGAVRSASVRLALAAAGRGDPVLVHDAARPLLSADLVSRALQAVAGTDVDAAIAAAPVTDTIKRASGEHPIVTNTVDRSNLWAVQTPQVFRRQALDQALDVAEELLAAATDDAWLIERTGGRVAIVPWSSPNLKVTTPTDLALAELLLARRPD
jgi:2-C-methyl-D-erythritol 4-phosphate cytidylyltransferase